jgi:hypothetical protein
MDGRPEGSSVEFMVARYVRPVSSAASWSRRLSIFALVLFLVATVVHRISLLATPDFIAVGAIAGAAAVLAFLLAVVGLLRLWQVGAEGGWSSLVGLVCSAVVLLPIGYGAWLYFDLPRIHDIASDLAAVPQWIEEPHADQEWMPRHDDIAAARRVQAEYYPQVVGRRYEGAVDRVLTAVRLAAADVDLQVVAESGTSTLPPDVGMPMPQPPASSDNGEAGGPVARNIPIPLERPNPVALDQMMAVKPRVVLIQATHRTPVFGFLSDVLIRLSEEEATTVVDIRVRSRYGDHDLGSGSALIGAFFDTLDKELLGTVTG